MFIDTLDAASAMPLRHMPRHDARLFADAAVRGYYCAMLPFQLLIAPAIRLTITLPLPPYYFRRYAPLLYAIA